MGVSKDGEVNTEDALSGKEAIGVYFSAHWCPPCRGFTPVFAKKYAELKEAGKNFEVVFVSSDSDEEACTSYYGEQPWLLMPYSDRERKETLSEKYDCQGIPHLVILDGTTGEVITTNGRAGISGANTVADFPYHPKPMYDVSESMDGIQGGLSIMLVQNYAPEETKTANSATLLKIAVEQKGLFHRFFTVNSSEDPCKFIRTQTGAKFYDAKPEYELTLMKSTECAYQDYGCDRCGDYKTCEERWHNVEKQADICKVCYDKPYGNPADEDKVPYMCVLNLKENKYFRPAEGCEGFSAENVAQFAKDVKDGKIEGKKLGE